MKLKSSIIFVFILIAQLARSQEAPLSEQWKEITKDYRSGTYVYLDPMNLDTLYENYKKSRQRVIISKEGVELSKGSLLAGMGTKCGCEPRPNGYWVKRYRNGNLKEHGVYDCNKKVGTWIYYHENGKLAKIETLQHPYLEFLTIHGTPWDTLKNKLSLLNGAYAEFYENGQMKVEGEFEIFEKYSATDTLTTFDSDTYVPIHEIVKGDFWIPKSREIGIWKYFDDKGNLTHRENKDAPYDYKTIRPLASRYFELFFKDMKE